MTASDRDNYNIIQRPPKIYLDTNHLINIANVRRGQELSTRQSEEAYRCIDEGIRSYCGLIFNPYAALEWVEGMATRETAAQIAAVVDSAKLKFLIEADTFVFTREVLDECRRQNTAIKVPDFPALQNLSDSDELISVIGILSTQVPDYLDKADMERVQSKGDIPTKLPAYQVQEWVRQTFLWKEKNPETYRGRVDKFKESLSEDIERKDEYFNNSQGYRLGWMKGFLKIDKILKAFNAQPDMDIDDLLKNVDVSACPAVDLYWKVREKRMISGNPPNNNDVDDYMFLPVVPYADIILTERNLRAFILQADKALESKVFHNASDAVQALDSLECLQ
jgi:hypothetical protein